MDREITVPLLGESITQAVVGQWFKKPGDWVIADEPLVELETDKVTVEVPSPVAGILSDIVVQNGETVSVGAVLAHLEERAQPPAASGEATKMRPSAIQPSSRAQTKAPATNPAPLAPSVRRLAAESGIDPGHVGGTGKNGRVTENDMLMAIEGAAATMGATTVSTPVRAHRTSVDVSREQRVPMTRLRQTIARRLKDAQTSAAMLTTFNEVDMTSVMALRNEYKDLFERKYGVKLGFMGFFVCACVQALKEVPAVNAHIDGDDIVYKKHYDIGVAVGTDKGLVVPVVRECDSKRVAHIEQEIADLGSRARKGELNLAEIQGGTFTISNGGVYGSLMSTPILNSGQSGILGMHRIQNRPIAVGGKIEIRPMMYLALSYDHCIIDGREAVTFLASVKDRLHDPARLLLQI